MLLETWDLTKLYGTYRALDSLTLSLAPGEVLGLLGPNGSGKTTALRLMLGFLRPSSGRASIAGHDCWSASVQARQQVAYLPGELRLYENMSGLQLIRFLSDLRGQPIREDLDALARRFDIDIHRPLTTLSSGMKRKVALLQVMAPRAPLVIMDEPTNALDPTMRDALLEQVKLARERGQAVLFSSHVMSEVEAVCDRVAILNRGQLVHVERLADLKQGRLVTARFEKQPETVPALPGLTVMENLTPTPGNNLTPTPLLKGEGLSEGNLTPTPLLKGEGLSEGNTPLAASERGGGVRFFTLTLEYTGPLPALLDWLSRQPLRELRMEPLGLRGIYARYHGAEE